MPENIRETNGDEPRRILIEVSTDEMEAFLTVRLSPDDTGFSSASVREALEEKEVTYGIKEDVLENLDTNGPPEDKILIAEGLHRTEGKDGSIKYMFEAGKPVKVAKDTKIAEIIPPEVGIDGVTVFDRKIPVREVNGAVMPDLYNVVLTGDGQFLMSTIEGYLQIKRFNAEVFPFFEIEFADEYNEALVRVARLVNEGDFGPDDLKSFISENGVVFGILDAEIGRIFSEELYERPVAIARGKKVLNGRNGEIKFHFETETKPDMDEQGNIDYRELNLIKSVKANDRLAEIVPPVPGEEGKTVLGDTIQPLEGTTPVLPIGKNTKPDPSKESILVSEIDGSVKLNQNRVEVDPVFSVRKNVDYSTGNIHFIGAVTVNGDVLSGFKIKAKGDVEVEGVVEDATIESEGSVLIKKGFIGKGSGIIAAKKDVTVSFCENERIVAEGDIHIISYAMNCNLETRGSILATEKAGLIVGGESYAVKGIEANTLGSDHGTPTKLFVGMDMVSVTYVNKIESQIAHIDSLLEKSMRRRLVKREPSPAVRDMLQKLNQAKEAKLKDKNSLLSRIRAMDDREHEFKKATVKVNDTVHPGTMVTIYDEHLTLQDPLKELSFRYTEEGVRVFSEEEKKEGERKQK